MTWAIALLIAGVAATFIRIPRVPASVAVAVVAFVALTTRVAPWGVLRQSVRLLAGPLAFLVVAVPLALVLDEIGFFDGVAARLSGGRQLRLGLWVLAAAVTVVLNLDAAIVLLTPLYVRIARRRGDDPVALAFIPVLMSSLASTVLPVSNLTNLIVVGHFDLDAADMLRHVAPASVAAVIVGWFAYRWLVAPATTVQPASASTEPIADGAMLAGSVVVGWLVLGFTVGDGLGIPAWIVAAIALAGLLIWRGRLRPPAIPLGVVVLSVSLGVLALAAAPHLRLDRFTGRGGVAGELASFGIAAVGADAVNNLPATMALLPSLSSQPDNVWAALLGVNMGPLLWPMGSLAVILWQATMTRLGGPVSTRRYVSVGARVGIPAMVAAVGVRLLLR